MMNKTQEAFAKINKDRKNMFTLTGDCLLVQVLNTTITTKSGLHIPAVHNQITGVAADKPTLVRVLLVGEGYYDDDTNADVPVDCNLGDILMVGQHSVKYISSMGDIMFGDADIAIVRFSEAQLHFKGQEGFDRFLNILRDNL